MRIGNSLYEIIDLFCPDCGHKGLYRKKGEGDYYHGMLYTCPKCFQEII